MININNFISRNSLQSTGVAQNNAGDTVEKVASSESQSTSGPKISTLAQQLNEAQTRVDARDESLDREALADKAKSLRKQITGSTYYQNKAKHDAEVPDTNDPAHLERAKQATAFTNGTGANPFSRLAPDQLTLIIYDESGTFTTNERRAARLEQNEQRYAREVAISNEIMRQWEQKNGDISEALEGIMEHYNNVPPIEEAQLHSNWRQYLESNIAHAKAQGNQSQPQLLIPSLFEMLFKQNSDSEDE
ncbi:hypothetical protein [Marinomonas fungiae]|uniref:Uncharacterized protein n=1 Tax=Marinomonas fungiae TaxID=1137284 RepID=A0A0K6IQX0_9GAMM|nr:hypothetical protein [Marinomonas fungiae]CUB05496.1 hypothetical protein Ga0061065_11181 [Marinomonas fungiae]